MGLIESVIDFLERFLPAIIGSAGSLLWVKGNNFRLLGVFILGAFMGVYLGDLLGEHFGINSEGSMLLTSLFSVSVVDKMFKGLEQTNILIIIERVGRLFK